MADRFPKDCWDKNCPYFHTRDLSVDDLVCTCDLLKIQCDACDEDFCLYLCPLPNEPKERGGEKWSEKRRNESITENVVSAESDTNKAK